MKGQLLVFEGCDGVGKTSLCTDVAERLKGEGQIILSLPFPGRTPGTLGGLVYDLHHAKGPIDSSNIAPDALQCLHIASHLNAIAKEIKPALEAGTTVILDRYWWSTLVYGIVSGVSSLVLKRLVRAEIAAWESIRPTHLFLVEREEPLRSEPADWISWKREYQFLAGKERLKYPVHLIQNNGTQAEAVATICDKIIAPKSSRGRPKKAAAQLQFGFHLESAAKPTYGPSTPSESSVKAWAPLKPTAALDTYWRFAAARQEVFFNRFERRSPPWSDDPILIEHKFTNAYRASDRVSQFLIKEVIYQGDQDPNEVFFRTLLFKFFNKIETWQHLNKFLGEPSLKRFSLGEYDAVLEKAISSGQRIYSAAYIMPTGGRGTEFRRKHLLHLSLLERMLKEGVPAKIQKAGSMQRAFQILKSYPTIGDFLAYQYATDLNYSNIVSFTEMEFVVPGPGALDGISKCFSDRAGHSETKIIQMMAKRQDEEFERLGLKFRDLWGRPLQLIDCQNLFCELSKYSRVAHPDIQGVSGRTRIKQKFKPITTPITYWYPPKWNLNQKIQEI